MHTTPTHSDEDVEFVKAFLDYDVYIKRVANYYDMYQAIIYNDELYGIEVPYFYGHKSELLHMLRLLPEHTPYRTIMNI